MTAKHRLDDIKEKFPEVFHKNFGNVTKTCEQLNIKRDTYYAWRKADPIWAAKCDEASEIALDLVESALYESILIDKVPSTMIFYLKTKGRSRGYIEKLETENTETVEVKLSANDKDIIEQYLKHSEIPNNSKSSKKAKNDNR